MIIEVKVFSFLSKYVPPSDFRLDGNRWEVPEGTTVDDVLKMLSLPEKEAKTLLLLVNDLHAERESVENDGDVLHVAPPIVGG